MQPSKTIEFEDDFLRGLQPGSGNDSNGEDNPWSAIQQIQESGIMLPQNPIAQQPGRLARSTEIDIEAQVISLLRTPNPFGNTGNPTLH